jgi:hypothetical protein
MDSDPFARQQGVSQPGQQWPPGEQQQSSAQPLQPAQWQPGQPPQWQPGQAAQWQPGQPPQWQPGQYGSQPQSQQAAWGQQPQWYPQDTPATPEWGRFPPRRRTPLRGFAIVISSLVGVAGVVVAALAATSSHHSSPSPAPAISGAPVSLPALPGQSGAPAGASTATLVVTGSSGAQVTYGPAGTDLTGSDPMRKTVALGSASTYEIKAQLNGSGTLKCQILIGNKVISQATTSGYGVAVCVIFQDPVSGQWQDATAG